MGFLGCGKIILLRIIVGFEELYLGIVIINGWVVVGKYDWIVLEKCNVGMVF